MSASLFFREFHATIRLNEAAVDWKSLDLSFLIDKARASLSMLRVRGLVSRAGGRRKRMMRASVRAWRTLMWCQRTWMR